MSPGSRKSAAFASRHRATDGAQTLTAAVTAARVSATSRLGTYWWFDVPIRHPEDVRQPNTIETIINDSFITA